jgi:RNA polymerase sigma-70 factor (ECF subfamily)
MPAIQSPETEEIHPDVALVARAKEGDTAAFEQLVRQYERQIFRVAQHITQNREDAEDITQDAFLKAYEKLDQFQGNSKFSTWLVRIAVNESLMRLRKRKTSKTVPMDEDVQTEDGSIPRDFAEWRPNPEQMYGQNELGDPTLLAEVETHVRECHHCEVVLDTTSKTISIYREHEIYEFPTELRERLHTAIMKKCGGC